MPSIVRACRRHNGCMPSLLWDLFCRVIDNHGDLGVCARLARDLASRGQTVRLWVDDSRALAWMVPQWPPGCTVHRWPAEIWPCDEQVGDVIVEAFGCELPLAVQARLGERRPCWLNLEYLSAEAYTLRCHLLPSPVMRGPAQGLVKTFWYPGFDPRSGGLLRERNLMERQSTHDSVAFLRQLGVSPAPGERVVSLFCYPRAPLESLAQGLGRTPTLLLICGAEVAPLGLGDQVRTQVLPWLPQDPYDQLLWSCDLNIVRGEDSFVRAQWAGRPMLWHIYAQDDGAHAAKLDAFLSLYLANCPLAEAQPLRQAWLAWNGLAPVQALEQHADRLFEPGPARRWREQLLGQADLTTQLLRWVMNGSPAGKP